MKTALAALVTIASLTLLAACSEPDGASEVRTPATVTTEAPEPRTGKAAKPAGDCDLLTTAEIEQAFDGKLQVKRISGNGERGRGCTVSIVQGEDSQLVFQVSSRQGFDALKQSYSAQSRISMEPIPVGAEAWLVNGAQVIAIDASERSINLGLMLIVFGEPLPLDKQTVASGVQTLAQTALGRL
jgi:hypothetical protein